MDEDFNTPEALAVLQSLARELNTAKAAGQDAAAAALAAELKSLARILGILAFEPGEWLGTRSALTAGESAGEGLDDARIDALVEARTAARRARNWAESDRIRDELAAAGVILEDAAGGTTWRRR
jgi:cysteinyl-tRNA synthetase